MVVFDYDPSSLYKEVLLPAWAYAVEKGSNSLHNLIAKLFSPIPMINRVFGAIKTTKHLSETTRNTLVLISMSSANSLETNYASVHTGFKALTT